MTDVAKKTRPLLRWQTIFIGRNPRWTLVRILVLVAVCTVVFKFILLPVRVEGSSMLPNYRDGRINFVNRLAYSSHEPKRGDVVSIRTSGTSIMYLKRIVGLPGETVAFADGELFINGRHEPEPYVKSEGRWGMSPRTLGADEYYVVGDNRRVTEHGVIARQRIVGKILL